MESAGGVYSSNVSHARTTPPTPSELLSDTCVNWYEEV